MLEFWTQTAGRHTQLFSEGVWGGGVNTLRRPAEGPPLPGDVDIDQLGKTADAEAGAAAGRRQTPCVDTSRCSPFSGRLLGDPDRIGGGGDRGGGQRVDLAACAPLWASRTPQGGIFLQSARNSA